jgi:hypothetical protein
MPNELLNLTLEDYNYLMALTGIVSAILIGFTVLTVLRS